jgi:hypothetical protein
MKEHLYVTKYLKVLEGLNTFPIISFKEIAYRAECSVPYVHMIKSGKRPAKKKVKVNE